MKRERKRTAIGGGVLLLLFLAGCAAQSAGQTVTDTPRTSAQTEVQPWEAWNISEDFYRVTQDFAQRYAVIDQDGYRHSQALAAVGDYLDGTGSADAAAQALQTTIDGCEEDLAAIQTFAADETLQGQLERCGISAEEYEMFVNNRSSDLYALQTSLETLLLLLQNAAIDPAAGEDLAFYYEMDTAEQDIMRSYYYYGSLNYWFAGAAEPEVTYLRQAVIPNFRFYVVEDDLWYDSRADVEARVMDSLDELEDLRNQMAQHVGQAQTGLYEMEQDYQDLLDQAELLEQLQDIQRRLEALSGEVEAASTANDTQRLAELEEELNQLVAEYEALTAQSES